MRDSERNGGRGARRARMLGALLLAGAASLGCARRVRTSSSGSIAGTRQAPRDTAALVRDQVSRALSRVRNDAQVLGMLQVVDSGETRAAAAALIQGVDPDVRAFAQRMINEHAALDEQIVLLAQREGLRPAAPDRTLSELQAEELESVRPFAGPAFDRAYAAQQILAHRRALALVEGAAARGATRPAVRAFLGDSVRVRVAEHLRSAENLLRRVQQVP